MITFNEAQLTLDMMPAAMAAKGKREPEAVFYLSANCEPALYVSWKDPNKVGYDRVSQTFRGAFGKAAKEAQAWIAALPSAEEAKLRDFMKGLGKLIDSGKDAGISLDYMNPLLDAMKKLSENVIAYQPNEPADA